MRKKLWTNTALQEYEENVKYGQPSFYEDIKEYWDMSKGNFSNHSKKYARQVDLEVVKEEIKDIKENHLAGIRQKIGRIEGSLLVLIPLIIAILSIAIALLVK